MIEISELLANRVEQVMDFLVNCVRQSIRLS